MPDTTPLGIPRPLDTDPVSDGALTVRDAVDFIDDMLTGRAAAWNQAGVSVGAGATVSMGSATLPASDKFQTLHIMVMTENTAAATNELTLTPDYADNARVANIGALRFPNGPVSVPQHRYLGLPLDAGSDATAMSFTLTAADALDDARVLTWIT